jgi:hypothetical protein
MPSACRKPRRDAEAYNRGACPAVSKLLASLIEGTSRVQTHEVLNSTIHKTLAVPA